MMMLMMKTIVLTMLAALLTSENSLGNGKMNFFFILMFNLMELIDCTILIGCDNAIGMVVLNFMIICNVEFYGNSFLVIMNAVDHCISLNGPLGRVSSLKIKRRCVCSPAGSYLRILAVVAQSDVCHTGGQEVTGLIPVRSSNIL